MTAYAKEVWKNPECDMYGDVDFWDFIDLIVEKKKERFEARKIVRDYAKSKITELMDKDYGDPEMIAEKERRIMMIDVIREIVDENGALTSFELAERLGIESMTARNDMAAMIKRKSNIFCDKGKRIGYTLTDRMWEKIEKGVYKIDKGL